MSSPDTLSVSPGDYDIGITSDFLFEGGAETVVEHLCQTFQQSTLYTAIYDPETLPLYPAMARALREGRLCTSFAQGLLRFPSLVRALSLYHFYWLYFIASSFQKTRRHDVVIVSCCAQSKLIRIPRGSRPVVYFHTPTRWLYPGLVTEADLAAIPWHLRGLMRLINRMLRPLDRLGIRRLTVHDPVWLCNSTYTRDRLREIYGIEARVVFPPVNVRRYSGVRRRPGGFFLYHGRLTFQKRVDVAIRGCLLARKRLMISGQAVSANLQRHLEEIVAEAVARDPGLDGLITFLGRTSDDEVRRLLSECAAMIFPPREDFGIAPIEAIASGVPVIAYSAGGALDYIRPGVNGRFFDAQTGAALAGVLGDFDPSQFDPGQVANSVPDFSGARFQREIRAIVDTALQPPKCAAP